MPVGMVVGLSQGDFVLDGDPAPPQKGHRMLGLGRFGFFKFGSIRFGFQSQLLGFGFFRFRYLHTTTMQEYPSV